MSDKSITMSLEEYQRIENKELQLDKIHKLERENEKLNQIIKNDLQFKNIKQFISTIDSSKITIIFNEKYDYVHHQVILIDKQYTESIENYNKLKSDNSILLYKIKTRLPNWLVKYVLK